MVSSNQSFFSRKLSFFFILSFLANKLLEAQKSLQLDYDTMSFMFEEKKLLFQHNPYAKKKMIFILKRNLVLLN